MYQEVLLQDKEGNKMSVALFGQQVATFGAALKYNCRYEIANATIQIHEIRNSNTAASGSYEMVFNSLTSIKCKEILRDERIPEYMCLADIPRSKVSALKFVLLCRESELQDCVWMLCVYFFPG